MNKLKWLQLKTLDQHIQNIQVCDRPTGGWIRAIRKTLGMTGQQLATRLGISQQSTARLEVNEISESISLKSLRKVADALDCQLVYALVPREESLEATIRKQAYLKAKELVVAVDKSMRLEAQGVNGVEEKIQELANTFAENINSKLWDNNGRSSRRTNPPRSRGKS